jgi:superfamily II DNA or RNA helicase
MATRKKKSKGPKAHKFSNKLLLNQWLISLFGIDPLAERQKGDPLPFHKLAAPIRGVQFEGLDPDNLHIFYHELIRSDFFWDDRSSISKDALLVYEQNIVSITQALNEKRDRPIIWKYFQWLTLLFTEIYLDRFFRDPDGLLDDLNGYVARFNARWPEYADVALFSPDDLNKVCLQNSTGSGKTLLMHCNVRQFEYYARKYGRHKEITRAILITPNERLSEQHVREMADSGLQGSLYLAERGGLFGEAKGLERVDVVEVTKLQDKEGPNTVATRSLGDKNLLLVDEGHRGLSGQNATDESTWFRHRNSLSEKGFTFEYSATFQQAVSGTSHEDAYAKMVLFDYSYRWFYEDGFGKDYKIDNLPDPDPATLARLVEKGNLNKATKLSNSRQVAEAMMPVYLTAALLKFYQQLRIYEENRNVFADFNIEKPLWVFVGSTVSKSSGTKDEKAVASDVAKVLLFFAMFLADPEQAKRQIDALLRGNGTTTGLLDPNGNDIFGGAFAYLLQEGLDVDALYSDLLARFFQNPHGGRMLLERVKGDSGEVALRSGTAETSFGLINVGDAKGLCDHIEEVSGGLVTVEDSDFTEAQFETVRDSDSPINLLVGSKKFVEGWDCWRVSCMGLMHVGKSEGAQIIQLFGRGVRLKGYEWSLKRSGHSHAPVRPPYIEELETLNVFGIEADFMERFKQFLAEEGLPGNERRETIRIPLNVTYDVGKRLKILRPKRKRDGKEYNFKKDGPVPGLGTIPQYLFDNPVVADWYARIQSLQSSGASAQ